MGVEPMSENDPYRSEFTCVTFYPEGKAVALGRRLPGRHPPVDVYCLTVHQHDGAAQLRQSQGPFEISFLNPAGDLNAREGAV